MPQRLHGALGRILRRLRGRPGRGGFTLVEILMVLVILSVGVLPIAIVQHHARREVTESDRLTRAVAVGQGQLERIKSLGFGNAVNEAGEDGNVTWASTVTNVAFGLDRIEVTVSWQEGRETVTMNFADLVSLR